MKTADLGVWNLLLTELNYALPRGDNQSRVSERGLNLRGTHSSRRPEAEVPFLAFASDARVGAACVRHFLAAGTRVVNGLWSIMPK